uniref:Uncharacterized protein n=1 Tax=Biomphalaria glabrata TaxID=6526 RepID=A0A2C9M3B2_BIOGL
MRNRGKIPDGSLRVVAEVNESIVRMKPPQRPGILGFIWSLLIVGCLVALALQVRQQVLYFFSNPKTINEETKFVDSVEFPTVTICNENAFRISAAYNLKLYDILNNMFNSSLTLDIVAEAGLINLTLDELNYLGGNDIHNMILK